MREYVKQPTVYPAPDFNASQDAGALREAMKGLGTDEEVIINVLTARSNKQRQEIAEIYNSEYDRDLIEDLKSELGGRFEDVIVALCLPPDVYLCKELHRAMEGLGTNEHTLIEILCSKDNDEVQSLVDTYESLYDRPLAEHMCSETSGDLRRLLTLIVTGVRSNSSEAEEDRAVEIAQELYDSGEGRLGTEESTFYKILVHESFNQLRVVFEKYKEVSGNTIEQALKHELSGEYLEGLLAIVACVENPAAYFAKRLYNSMKGLGTDDNTLIRIIVSRSEIDLETIKNEFEKLYEKTLKSMVENDTSGDYKLALLGLIR